MSARSRKWVIFAAVFLGVAVLLAVVVVPAIVDLNHYRPEVEALLQRETGKPAHIGHLKLTLIPHLAIQVDDFSLGNPQGFPAGNFFKTKRIYALVQAGPLLQKKIVIQSLIVEAPVIHLINNSQGVWNYADPPAPASPANTKKTSSDPVQPAFSLKGISKVNIKQGQVTVVNLLRSGEMGPAYINVQGLSCQFQDVNLTALDPARAAASPPTAAQAAGPIIPAADNHSPQVAHGSFHADSLRFGSFPAKSVVARIQVFPKQAYLHSLTFKLADGSVRGSAATDFSQPNLRYSAQTQFQKINVAQLLIAIPSARGKLTGTMAGNLSLNGAATHSSDPLSGLEGTGQVRIINGKLPTLQLNRNLLLLVRMAGIGSSSGDPSSFSSISTDLSLADQKLASHDLRIVSTDANVNAAGIVDLSGSNQIHYTGTAFVPARQTRLTNLVAGLSGASYSNGKLSFSFELRGTLQNPKFSLTGKGALGGLAGKSGSGAAQPRKAIQNLLNMFGRKKSSSTSPKQ